MEGLLSPRTSLRTLSEARFAQDGTGALLLERTTLFAEAQVGKKLLYDQLKHIIPVGILIFLLEF